ncbi:MAG TPA: ABC transporter substrate-binding protein [Anaeromyxobacter sp.]|nr:ABC transporter substrate-binding protein [Anaeromyxobacter sp.]
MHPSGRAPAILAFAALVAASPARAADATVKIGACLSLTGPAALYGAQQKAGIQAAVEEVNREGQIPGVKLEVVIEDDASTKEQGIAVYQRLIGRDRVSAILGPTLSNTATAVDPLAQSAKVPVVAISNTAPRGITDIGDYIFRVSLTEGQVIPAALKRAHARLHFGTAGVLYGNDDAFTQAGFGVMRGALEALGVRILGTQTFAKPDRDYNAQLTALIALKPDILVVSALVENAAGIVTQARQLGWRGPILGGNGFNSAAFVRNAGPAAEGVLVGTSWNRSSPDPANQAFLRLMAGRGAEPDQFCAQAYAGVLVIARALAASGGKGGREDLRAALATVKDLDTPLGRFSFLENRDGSHEPALQEVRDGRFQIAP